MKSTFKLFLLVFGLNVLLTSCTVQDLDNDDSVTITDTGTQDSNPPSEPND